MNLRLELGDIQRIRNRVAREDYDGMAFVREFEKEFGQPFSITDLTTSELKEMIEERERKASTYGVDAPYPLL